MHEVSSAAAGISRQRVEVDRCPDRGGYLQRAPDERGAAIRASSTIALGSLEAHSWLSLG